MSTDPHAGPRGRSLESLLSPRALEDFSVGPALMRRSVRQQLFGGPPEVLKIGRFVVLDRIGSGGMGVVLEAYDPKLERKIAVKVLHPTAEHDDEIGRRRLLREARSLAKLSHPNVVPVFEVGEHGPDVFIAMERVSGETLGEYARAPGRAAREIVEVYAQAARGLAAAHAEGLVHRDFKPTNALVGRDGRVRVLDFGLARGTQTRGTPEPSSDSSGEHARESLTQTGALVGTPAYMAPEQRDGAPATAASDQYSLCASLFEALTAELPVTATRRGALPAAMMSCPRALRPIVSRGLALEPSERWPSMQDLCAALEGVSQRRRRWGGLAIGVTAVVVALVALRPRDSPCDSLEPAWEPDQREQADVALHRANPQLAPTSVAALERYAETWGEVQVETCVAHHEKQVTSDRLFDRAMLCLDRRRRALSTLVEYLTILDETSAARAMDAIAALPDPERCRERERLLAERPLPDDPAIAAATVEIRAALDRAEILGRLGDLEGSAELARDADERATALRYRPSQARTALFIGVNQYTRGDIDDAVPTLESALWLAEAGGDDALTARASSLLTRAFAMQGKSDAVDAQARRTEAAIERLGRPSGADIILNDARGMLAYLEGRLADAREHLGHALELAERLPDASDSFVAQLLDRVASIDAALGEHERAHAMHERALRFKEASFGALHPSVLVTRFHLASAKVAEGQLDEGIETLHAVLDDAQRSLGEGSALAGTIHGNLNIAYTRARREDEATEHARRSVEILREVLGPEAPGLIAPVSNLGGTYFEFRRFEQARATFEEAIALGRSAARGGVDLGSALVSVAEIDVHERDYDSALRRVSEAVPMLEQGFKQPVHPELSRAHAVARDAYRGLDDLDSAQAAARRSVAAAPPDDRSEMLAAFALAEIARAQGQRTEAEAQVRRAIEVAQRREEPEAEQKYRRWLTSDLRLQPARRP